MTDWRQASPKGNDNVATSPSLWRPLSEGIGGFDLDPAAGCEPEQIATERFTRSDDGLSQSWWGNVWLNPPFSEKQQWYKRLFDQWHNGDVDRAVAVAPVDTSTEWFQGWFSTADVLGFLEGRDHFVRNPGSGGSASFSTVVGVWNPTVGVIERLSAMGIVCHVPKIHNETVKPGNSQWFRSGDGNVEG